MATSNKGVSRLAGEACRLRFFGLLLDPNGTRAP